ncbi:MAG: Fur family transcriptional regulator [Lachnospiraceae bacterium]
MMDNNTVSYSDILRESGLRVTPQRLAIIDVFLERPGQHMTAEEIYNYVQEKAPKTGIATVYRNIEMLADMHVLDRLNLNDGYVRYELGDPAGSGRHHHHHHMICLGCGRVFAFDKDLLENLEESIREDTGFQVTDHEVKLYGYCRECLEKQKNEKNGQ